VKRAIGLMSRIEPEYRTNWHREYLHSHNYQQGLKLLDQDWQSYFASIKDYKINPSKYKGEPRKPGYKHENRKAEIIFTNYGVRLKGPYLLLSLSKKMQEKFNVKSLNLPFPQKVAEQVNFENLQQVRLIWRQSERRWEVILIYNKVAEACPESHGNIMSIDLGLDNLCAITFRDSKAQYLINGKTLKSKNSYFNKRMAELTSQRMLETGSEKFKRTHQMKQLQRKRNNIIKDGLHKASREVVMLAEEHRCRVILIGDLGGIKQGSTIKSFIQIPISELVQQIRYKAELKGIRVLLIKEQYTSGVSAYDLETLGKEAYNKSRRVKRGLFRTNEGYLVNSDINGALNIMRRYMQEEKTNVVPILIKELRDNGCMDHPVRLKAI
jgi:putative transposase